MARHDSLGDRPLALWRTPAGQALARRSRQLSRRLGAHGAGLALFALAMLCILALTSAVAETYDAVAERDGIALLDQPALHEAMRLRSPGRDHLVTLFTDLGGPVVMPVLTLVVAVGLALLWRGWTPLVLIGVGAAGSLAMTVVGKQLVGRVRPPLADAVPPYEHSPSFPSGHTLNSTVVVGLVVYLLMVHLSSRTARTAAVVLGAAFVLAMGLSRVYLGHHWLTDVVVGWALGLLWVTVLVTLHRLWVSWREPHPRQMSEPTTSEPTTSEPTTSEPTTSEPTTSEG